MLLSLQFRFAQFHLASIAPTYAQVTLHTFLHNSLPFLLHLLFFPLKLIPRPLSCIKQLNDLIFPLPTTLTVLASIKHFNISFFTNIKLIIFFTSKLFLLYQLSYIYGKFCIRRMHQAHISHLTKINPLPTNLIFSSNPKVTFYTNLLSIIYPAIQVTPHNFFKAPLPPSKHTSDHSRKSHSPQMDHMLRSRIP